MFFIKNFIGFFRIVPLLLAGILFLTPAASFFAAEDENLGEKEKSEGIKEYRIEFRRLSDEESASASVPSETAAPQEQTGRLIADYRSGSGKGFTALETPDGRILTVDEPDLIALEETGNEFKPLDLNGLREKLLAEAGPHFKLLSGKRFLVIYNTSEAYASWCLKLFESLYIGLDKYLTRRELHFPDPECLMPVLLFSNREEFADYARRDMPSSDGIVAYYNRVSNRVVLYDLSEEETGRSGERKRGPVTVQIREFLSRPNAAFNVATIVHEAVHQIAFNRKIFLRTGPYPLWLTEGLSMFFETPDGNAISGWSRKNSTIRPNPLRLAQLRDYFSRAQGDPVREIITAEEFSDNLLDSYALSWGLFHYLNAKEPKKLAAYIERIAQKPPYALYTEEERLADFCSVFGGDWETFYKNFINYYNVLK